MVLNGRWTQVLRFSRKFTCPPKIPRLAAAFEWVCARVPVYVRFSLTFVTGRPHRHHKLYLTYILVVYDMNDDPFHFRKSYWYPMTPEEWEGAISDIQQECAWRIHRFILADRRRVGPGG
jgi:hypothetical protein